MKYYVFDPMVLRKSLNPLQEVGVMKFNAAFCNTKVFGLNPLQEVGVMKSKKKNGEAVKTVLIPFRKSG